MSKLDQELLNGVGVYILLLETDIFMAGQSVAK